MKVAGAQTPSLVAVAYRATFREYSRKLESLQRLMESENFDAARMEATLLEVETARIAHSCARDTLARHLIRSAAERMPPPASGISQNHIRDTAHLLWEIAGKPDGTAEGDWHKAEKLVQQAAAAAC